MGPQHNKKISPFIQTRAQAKTKGAIPIIQTKNQTSLKSDESSSTKNKHTTDNLSRGNKLLKTPQAKISNINETMQVNINISKEQYETLEKQLRSCHDKLDILGDTWLSDDVISKYFEILRVKIIGDEGTCLLVDPSVAQGVKISNETSNFLDLLDVQGKEIIIVPINDHLENFEERKRQIKEKKEGGTTDEGTHWSTLVYLKNKNTFFHYDSLNNANLSQAEETAKKLSKFYKTPFTGVNNVPGPKQHNSFDCGIYLIYFTEYVLLNYKTHNFFENFQIPHQFGYLDCIRKRSYVTCILHRNFLVNKKTLLSFMVPGSSFQEDNADKKTLESRKIDKIQLFSTDKSCNSAEIVNKSDQVSRETSRSYCPQPTFCKENHFKSTLDNLTVLADSQGREIPSQLVGMLKNSMTVSCYLYPGAHLETIVKSSSKISNLRFYGKKDWVVLIGGCNNIDTYVNKDPNEVVKRFKRTLEEQINKLQNTNLIVANIPYRYDLHSNDVRHDIVLELNKVIKQLVDKHSDVFLLDLFLLERFQHSKDGYHINRRGSKVVSRMLSDMVKKQAGIDMAQKFLDSTSGVEVIDQDMTAVFKKYKSDSSVAFAHSISGDFGNDRQMTAGVAVKFRKEFGRPTTWDCISSHLAYQNSSNGAGVYSLITKLNYFGKPTQANYKMAFKSLATDFRERKFKSLICSPIGCIRDNVQLTDFAREIIFFKKQTGAAVKIITYDQESSQRVLRNGLSHQEFIRQLLSCLNQEHLNAESCCPRLVEEESMPNNAEPTLMNRMLTDTLISAATPTQMSPTSPSDVSTTSTSLWQGWPSFCSTPSSGKNIPDCSVSGGENNQKQSMCGSDFQPITPTYV